MSFVVFAVGFEQYVVGESKVAALYKLMASENLALLCSYGKTLLLWITWCERELGTMPEGLGLIGLLRGVEGGAVVYEYI